MSKIVAYLIAFLVTFPFIVTMLTYFILNYFIEHRKKVIHKCMEYTAVVHLISTIAIFNVIFKINIFGPLVIFLLIVLFSFILLQWKLIRDVKMRRILKLYLRFIFLLFFIANLILTCFSIYYLFTN
ncbi:MAG TPA: DUF3397 domain-containing protein [Bacilli bacterium]|uniref:DUF3397 domain-containing protein n=1 Tax=Amphibacillus indicireducens TaxID=1076330 RepID=A0ABP7VLT2_9BACI|nr:DUF3397 domain-containing protein [Bacilli bacterium]